MINKKILCTVIIIAASTLYTNSMLRRATNLTTNGRQPVTAVTQRNISRRTLNSYSSKLSLLQRAKMYLTNWFRPTPIQSQDTFKSSEIRPPYQPVVVHRLPIMSPEELKGKPFIDIVVAQLPLFSKKTIEYNIKELLYKQKFESLDPTEQYELQTSIDTLQTVSRIISEEHPKAYYEYKLRYLLDYYNNSMPQTVDNIIRQIIVDNVAYKDPEYPYNKKKLLNDIENTMTLYKAHSEWETSSPPKEYFTKQLTILHRIENDVRAQKDPFKNPRDVIMENAQYFGSFFVTLNTLEKIQEKREKIEWLLQSH